MHEKHERTRRKHKSRNHSTNASQRNGQNERKHRRTSQNLTAPTNQSVTGWASVASKHTPRPEPLNQVTRRISQTSQLRENNLHKTGSNAKRRDSTTSSLIRQQSKITITKQDSHWSLTRKGKIAKYGLFSFNVLFMLTGAALLALGTWMKLDKNVASFQTAIHVDKINKIYIEIAAYVLIGFGILVMFIAFFGCCGACSESSFLLTVYVILLLAVYGGEVTICVLGYLYKNKIMSTVKPKLASTFQNGKYEPNNNYAKAWDVVQVALKCCGVYNFSDYGNSTGWKSQKQFVPTSCCASKVKKGIAIPNDAVKCQKEANPLIKPIKYEYLNHKGCFDTVMKWIYDNISIVGGVLGAIVLIELMGIIMACCVCFSRHRKPSTETIHRELL